MSSAWAICREARRAAGLTQRALAERSGVSPSTVARVERGRMEPTFELLHRLVDAAGLQLRVRLVPDDGTAHPGTSVSFEDRLRSLRSLSAFAIEARRATGARGATS